MNNITTLNTGFGTIRTIIVGSSEWFVAADVCKIVNLHNTTLCLKKIDESETKKCIVKSTVMNIISRIGVCQLCDVFSKQPNSQALKKWVKETYHMKEHLEPRPIKTTVNQTPIEVALGVDETGHVSAKKLYDWLGLEASHYTHWVKRNILENPFANALEDFSPCEAKTSIGEDYSSLRTKTSELGGRPSTDYLLSASFAKKLAMMTKTERGEQAREYFIKVEEQLANKCKEEKAPENQSGSAMMVFAKTLEQMVLMQKDMNDKFSQMMDMMIKRESAPISAPASQPTSKEKKTPTKKVESTSRKTAYDNIMNARKYPVTATVISKDFGLDVRAFNVMLSMQGIIEKNGDCWEPTEDFKESGIMQSFTFMDHVAGRLKVNNKWTRVGNELIREVLLKGYNMNPICERV